VIEFTSERIEALQEEIAARLGYEIVHHRLELYGRRIGRRERHSARGGGEAEQRHADALAAEREAQRAVALAAQGSERAIKPRPVNQPSSERVKHDSPAALGLS
jgi:hypothetical protein